MNSITVNIPASSELSKARKAIAIALFESEIFSSGQAAEFLNISRGEFIQELGSNGISLLSEDINDLQEAFNIDLGTEWK